MEGGQRAEVAVEPAVRRGVLPALKGKQPSARVVALADRRRALPDEEADAAFRRLLKIARGDTGHAKYCANLLLSWWNARICGRSAPASARTCCASSPSSGATTTILPATAYGPTSRSCCDFGARTY